jgi:hypothetical protein
MAWIHLAALAALAATTVRAQSPVLLAPVASSAVAGVGANQQTVPVVAGPLPAQGTASASAVGPNGGAIADLSWSLTSGVGGFDLMVGAQATAVGSGAQATAGPLDVVLELSHPTPLPVVIECSRLGFGSPGLPIPTTRVDVRDDGSFELDETTAQTTATELVILGPTPVRVRCRIGAAAPTIGSTLGSLRLLGRPGATNATIVQQGCSGASFVVAPRFDGDLDYRIDNVFAGSSAAVFGLGLQPWFFGVNAPGGLPLPCLLLPRADAVVFLPDDQWRRLVVPPAARPFTLFAQSVQLAPAGLWTSMAWQVDAF